MARKPAPNYAVMSPMFPALPAVTLATAMPEQLAEKGAMSVTKAARFLGVKKDTMRVLVKRRAVPSVKVGKLRQVLVVGLQLYLSDLIREQGEWPQAQLLTPTRGAA